MRKEEGEPRGDEWEALAGRRSLDKLGRIGVSVKTLWRWQKLGLRLGLGSWLLINYQRGHK